ncbi:MAG: tryptophan synthase subunit beta [Bacteroidales bacterium]|jgi:tryptophan synthase beta chain|nr:tryptophan synthase subunit beta [Bacteroidales bacterium]
MVNFIPNEDGFYGEFGGAFIPDILKKNIQELKESYSDIIESEDFKAEYINLLRDYCGRPTPLYYAERLSEKYNTNIFLKREDLNHTGAHKINNTIGQILLARKLGKKRIIAETGAGQHGVATATVCARFGMECTVHMGAKDIERQAPNVGRMKLLGANVIAATSGSQTLKDACNEAINDWVNSSEDTFYILGSVVGPHPYPDMVAKFQSIISLEISEQFKEKTGKDSPDNIVACIGGGSNATGAFYHFIKNQKVKLFGAEAAGLGIDTDKHAASLSKGEIGILHASRSYILKDKDGNVKDSYSISSGLDYPGIGPLIAHLYKSKRINCVAVTDSQALNAADNLMKTEGIIPAVESSHALAVLDMVSFREDETVVVNVSGRGDKDLDTYLKNIN